jgi:hypothetical protein
MSSTSTSGLSCRVDAFVAIFTGEPFAANRELIDAYPEADPRARGQPAGSRIDHFAGSRCRGKKAKRFHAIPPRGVGR